MTVNDDGRRPFRYTIWANQHDLPAINAIAPDMELRRRVHNAALACDLASNLLKAVKARIQTHPLHPTDLCIILDKMTDVLMDSYRLYDIPNAWDNQQADKQAAAQRNKPEAEASPSNPGHSLNPDIPF